jgi:hypothetical protein
LSFTTEAVDRLAPGVALSVCKQQFYVGKQLPVLDDVEEWAWYHRLAGVGRVYVSAQPEFWPFWREHQGWVQEDQPPFGEFTTPFDPVWDRHWDGPAMHGRLTFCAHENWRDTYILQDLSNDEFLDCPGVPLADHVATLLRIARDPQTADASYPSRFASRFAHGISDTDARGLRRAGIFITPEDAHDTPGTLRTRSTPMLCLSRRTHVLEKFLGIPTPRDASALLIENTTSYLIPGPNVQHKCMVSPAPVVHSSPHETHFLGCPLALAGEHGECHHKGTSAFAIGSEFAKLAQVLSDVNFTTKSHCRRFCGFWGEEEAGCSRYADKTLERKCWQRFKWGVHAPADSTSSILKTCHINHIRPDFIRTREEEPRGRDCHLLEHASQVRMQMGLPAREKDRAIELRLCKSLKHT